MNVQRWMTRTLITCTPEDSLQRAAQLLWENDLGSLPVIDAERRLVGMITDRDLCMASFTRGSSLASHTVGSAMARKLFTLAPKDTLARVHELMRKHQIRRVPVVDAAGVLVGVLTLLDVTRATEALAKRARPKATAELLATLSAIGRSRPLATPKPESTPAKAAAATKTVLAPPRASKKKPAATAARRSGARGATQRAFARAR